MGGGWKGTNQEYRSEKSCSIANGRRNAWFRVGRKKQGIAPEFPGFGSAQSPRGREVILGSNSAVQRYFRSGRFVVRDIDDRLDLMLGLD
jgi:hypothetical protein